MLSNKLILFFLSALIIYPSWFTNSSYFRLYEPFQFLAVALFTSLIFSPLLDKNENRFSLLKKRTQVILKDPFFYFGSFFIFYLVIQYLNSGAVRIPDDSSIGGIRFVATGNAFLPFSVQDYYAWKIILWSFSAWSIILTLRHGITKNGKKTLVTIILTNAFLLGIVGIAQYFSGTGDMLWLFPANGDFFYSTFGYENFGGAFFTLMFALSSGYLIDSITTYQQNRSRFNLIKICYTLICMPIFAFSIFLTSTRFCYLELFGLLVLLSIALFILFFRKVSRRSSIVVLLLVTIVCTGVFSLAYYSNHYVAKDLRKMTSSGPAFFAREFSVRTWQWEAAVKIWRDYPVYGTGHDGMKLIQQLYLNPDEIRMGQSFGKANTHNDFLQYLSELGLLGMTLLMFALGSLFINAFCLHFWKEPLLFWIFVGIGANAVHSLIDLPYRNCFNIMTTAALIAIISCYQRLDSCDIVLTKPVGRWFKSVSFITLFSVLLYLGMFLLKPLKKVKVEELIIQSQQSDDYREKLRLLEKANRTYPGLELVRKSLADALMETLIETHDSILLKRAAFYSQQVYLSDYRNEDAALTFAKAMEKSGYIWEAYNALVVLQMANPKSEKAFKALKFFYLRHGYRRNAIELMKNSKKIEN